MIEAFTGLPGQGKTYTMVKRAYQLHKRGKKVYANFSTTFATYFKELYEIYDVKDALILIDEAGIYLPAQAWQKIPFEFMRAIRQHRHNGLDMWYTAQDMQDVSTALRRVTQFEHNYSKMAKLVYCKTISPRTKEKFGFDIQILSNKVFKLYDTNFDVQLAEYLTT
jgi:zona occludens toxin (predicted ATPase)